MTQLTKRRRGEVSYQLQPVGRIPLYINHDVPVDHPLGNSDKLSLFHVPVNAFELQYVRVTQRAPEHDFFAELLE
jgi:hypothetical protein